MKLIDNYLNNITMYRLITYYLLFLVGVSSVLSILGILPFNIFALLFSVSFLVVVSWITNTVFSKVFHAATNIESVYISALILALIITPVQSFHDVIFLGWVAVWTNASKYIFAIGKKHIFNPVAISVTITAYAIGQGASWWIGNFSMIPFVLIGGLLIVKKIKREDLVFSFMFTAILVIFVFGMLKGTDLVTMLQKTLFYSPLLFFAFVMLTEPLTTPATGTLQVLYGALVGFLFAPQVHIGSFYTTPETALLMGNVFSYIVSPKDKLILKLKEKIRLAPDIYDFIFHIEKRLAFIPGQYMEWTLDHNNPDNRGNRRYFTLASSPTEDEVRIGIKFYNTPSSFKKSMLEMDGDHEIIASQLAGDFVLSKNPETKYVFIAGGIGITPFRSIIKYLLDIHEKRSVVLFYSNRTASEIVYKDVFDEAKELLGIKTIYTLTDRDNVSPSWEGKVGHIDPQMMASEVSDFKDRIFYLSGPRSLVSAFEAVLKNMGLSNNQIKTDFFPGFV